MKTLKEIRESKKLSKDIFSKRSGFDLDTISNFESGDRKPTSSEIEILAYSLNMPLDRLLDTLRK